MVEGFRVRLDFVSIVREKAKIDRSTKKHKEREREKQRNRARERERGRQNNNYPIASSRTIHIP